MMRRRRRRRRRSKPNLRQPMICQTFLTVLATPSPPGSSSASTPEKSDCAFSQHLGGFLCCNKSDFSFGKEAMTQTWKRKYNA
jgi:hypothetical protein